MRIGKEQNIHMNKTALGRRINAARKDRGITGEKLAERCHLNATYLRQIDGGAKTPSLPVFVTICQQLGVSPDYLLAEDLTKSEAKGFAQLLTGASPSQLKLITAMIHSALDVAE